MRRWRDRRGSALVEFALVAPILIFLLVGTAVMGLVINSKIVVSGAAREGGRTFAISQDASQTRLRAREAIVGGGLKERFRGRTLFDHNRDVQITLDGVYVTVTVTYRQPTFVPFLPRLLDRSAAAWDDVVVLQSAAVFRVEGMSR